MTNETNRYKSPGALKSAFERRYRSEPARVLVMIMQRFAARVCAHFDQAVIKGGLGLELRLETPRTTEDVDLIIAGSKDLDQRLSEAGQLDLGDFLRFMVMPDKTKSTFQVPGMPYPGKRYLIQAFFADRKPVATQQPFRRFKLEISIREPAAFDEYLSVWDGFEQVPPAQLRVYDIYWQLAEKVHAYTDPRHRDAVNSKMWRPRDLVDICRCATSPSIVIDAEKQHNALVQTFSRRKKADSSLHDLPPELPGLPSTWIPSFEGLVVEAALPWKTPAQAHKVASDLIDPVLGERARGLWSPRSGWAGTDSP